MAINRAYEIVVDSSVSDDKKAEIQAKIVRALAYRTRSIAYAASYSAGSSSESQISIEIGGASEDFGIRVIFDSAVVGAGVVGDILETMLRELRSETRVFVFDNTYTAGDRAYNLVITLT